MRIAVPLYCLSYRDVSPWFFLKPEMESRGHTVKFLPILDFQTIKDFHPDVIVVNDVYQDLLFRVCSVYHSWRIPVFQLSSEGIWSLEDGYKVAWDVSHPSDYLQEGIAHWGQDQLQAFVKAGKEEKFQYLTGSPRHSLWAYPGILEKLRNSAREQIKVPGKYKKVVTFACSNLLYGIDDPHILEKVGRKVSHPAEAMRTRFQLVKEAMTNLIRDHQDVYFILKLHPSQVLIDSLEPEVPKEGEFENTCYCTWEPIVEELIQITDLWISIRSTTTVEAWFKNLPTINLKFGELGKKYSTEYEPGSWLADDEHQLRDIFENFLRGKSLSGEIQDYRKKFLTSRFYRIDGKSYIRVADAIEDYLQKVGSCSKEIHFRPLPIAKIKGEAAALLDRMTGRFGFYWRDLFSKKLRLTPETIVNEQNYSSFYRYLQAAIYKEAFENQKSQPAIKSVTGD